METPTADQTDRPDQSARRAKGGVAGTDSKDFDSDDTFDDKEKTDTEPTPHPDNG
jgi:hypothetical protein